MIAHGLDALQAVDRGAGVVAHALEVAQRDLLVHGVVLDEQDVEGNGVGEADDRVGEHRRGRDAWRGTDDDVPEHVVQGVGLDGLGQAEEERVVIDVAARAFAGRSQQDDGQTGVVGAELGGEFQTGGVGQDLVDDGGGEPALFGENPGLGHRGRDAGLEVPGREAVVKHGAVDGMVIHGEHGATGQRREERRRAGVGDVDGAGQDVEMEA